MQNKRASPIDVDMVYKDCCVIAKYGLYYEFFDEWTMHNNKKNGYRVVWAFVKLDFQI